MSNTINGMDTCGQCFYFHRKPSMDKGDCMGAPPQVDSRGFMIVERLVPSGRPMCAVFKRRPNPENLTVSEMAATAMLARKNGVLTVPVPVAVEVRPPSSGKKGAGR
jgi:hypothetical protein